MRPIVPLVLALALLPVTLAEAPREGSRPYVTPAWPLTYVEAALVPDACDDLRLGGACFRIQPGESRVALRMEDALGTRVAAFAEFKADAQGPNLAYDFFCGASAYAIPAGATIVRVTLAPEMTFVPETCPLGEGGPSSTGLIHASFT